MCFYSIPYCYSFTFIWLKTTNFKSSWPFNRGIKQKKSPLGRQEATRGVAVDNFSGTLAAGRQI